jgi:hypothetical protein
MRAWVAGGCALGGAALGALLMWTLGPSLKSEGAGDKQEAAATEAGGPIGLALDAKTQAAAGIRIEPVASARQATSRTGYAHAVDLSPLAALAADAEAARAAVAASQKQVSRLAALAAQDQAAAPKDVEAARTQLAADQAKLKLSCERVGLDFGAGLARLGCNWIPRIVREAAEGRAALVRIDAIGGLPPAGGSVLVGEGAEAVTGIRRSAARSRAGTAGAPRRRSGAERRARAAHRADARRWGDVRISRARAQQVRTRCTGRRRADG